MPVYKNEIYRSKMGFAMPLSDWFRGRLGDFLLDLYKEIPAVEAGYILPQVMEETLRCHQKRGGGATRLWLLLWLELWFREQIQ